MFQKLVGIILKLRISRCRECGINKRSGVNHYEWKPDRVEHELNCIFKQRSYKLISMVLNYTGHLKEQKSYKLLGYNHIQLKEHIINHPNWEIVKNKKWHIDHIFPIKAFLEYGITDVSLINCLDNLQPLDAKKNLCKNDKYDKREFLLG